jgi:hypothetical protein
MAFYVRTRRAEVISHHAFHLAAEAVSNMNGRV